MEFNYRSFMLLMASILLFSCNNEKPFSNGKWIDLTHDFSSETIYWPTAEGFKLDVVADGMTEGGYYYAANNFSAAEHGGTHLDSPIHFSEGRKSVEQLTLDQLIGTAAVIDVSSSALENPDYLISVTDLSDWEIRHGRIQDGAILLFNTGYGQFWPDRKKYMGTDQVGPDAVPLLHFPGIDPEAAKWLVENRNIKAVGLDTPSIDYGQSTLFETHQVLYEKNIPGFENVAHLDQLPATGAFIIALPIKIKGGSGAPLRIVAFVEDY